MLSSRIIKVGVLDTNKVSNDRMFSLSPPLSVSISVKENWLQVDLSHPTRVTALVTKGRGDRGEQWVTKYMLAFSNDTRLWVYYNDAQRTEPKVGEDAFEAAEYELSLIHI